MPSRTAAYELPAHPTFCYPCDEVVMLVVPEDVDEDDDRSAGRCPLCHRVPEDVERAIATEPSAEQHRLVARALGYEDTADVSPQEVRDA